MDYYILELSIIVKIYSHLKVSLMNFDLIDVFVQYLSVNI